MLNQSIISALPSDVDRKEFEKRCRGAADLFAHFGLVLQHRLEAHQATAMKSQKYEMSSWPYYQADSIGYTRALEEAIKLFKFKE